MSKDRVKVLGYNKNVSFSSEDDIQDKVKLYASILSKDGFLRQGKDMRQHPKQGRFFLRQRKGYNEVIDRINPRGLEHTAPTDGVTVWDVMAYNTLSTLVLIRGTMTAQRNVHDILQPYVLPLMQWLPGAIFQQDNARPHTARVSQDCLRNVTTLPWPARSPDLSPIEHIWNHLARRVEHPTSLIEPEARLQQIWNESSQDIIQNLYASMPARIASCIRAREDSTGY
ncbi:transposable element Tcb1 transposase [Trichonephila clavipes]|nr:transposable element Tcb1 transposase [Trichonephila clavipes]